MKIKNNSPRNYIAFDTIIKAGETIEIEDKKTLELLLKQEGVEEAVDKATLKKVEEENEKLKKELEAIKAKEEKPKRNKKQKEVEVKEEESK